MIYSTHLHVAAAGPVRYGREGVEKKGEWQKSKSFLLSVNSMRIASNLSYHGGNSRKPQACTLSENYMETLSTALLLSNY